MRKLAMLLVLFFVVAAPVEAKPNKAAPLCPATSGHFHGLCLVLK
jgi:hypothetical protein